METAVYGRGQGSARTGDKMLAAVIHDYGGPEKITTEEVPLPVLGRCDVLVRLVASEANHIDRYILSGQYQTTLQFPFIVGRDAVGVVADVGSGITKFAVGDAVWTNSLGYDGRQGAMAEYVVAQGDRLYHLAEGIAPTEAASVLHGGATAYLGLVREGHLQPGDRVFVGGAGGAVGSAALQIAVAMEAIVAVSASPEDERWCRSLGASLVVDYHDANYQEQVARHLGPVDIWWDTSGNLDLAAVVPLMNRGGRILLTAGMEHILELPAGEFYTRDISLRGFSISNASVDDLAAAAHAMNHLMREGRLRGRGAATYRLSEVRQAYEDLASGLLRGRIVIVA